MTSDSDFNECAYKQDYGCCLPQGPPLYLSKKKAHQNQNTQEKHLEKYYSSIYYKKKF